MKSKRFTVSKIRKISNVDLRTLDFEKFIFIIPTNLPVEQEIKFVSPQCIITTSTLLITNSLKKCKNIKTYNKVQL